MKIALISDIHGNTVALKQVLADARKNKADQIICLGDSFINGANPVGTLHMLREENIPSVRGNTEDFICDAYRSKCASERFNNLKEPLQQTVAWCAENFSEEDISYLESLPLTRNIELPHNLSLLCYHATPNANIEILRENSENELFEQLTKDFSADFYAGGHTHTPYIKKYMGKTFLNPGCLGIPIAKIDEEKKLSLYSGAEYMMLDVTPEGDIDIQIKRIHMAKEELLALVMESEMPNKDVRINLLRESIVG